MRSKQCQRLLCALLLVGVIPLADAQTPRDEIAERIGPVLADPPVTGLLVFDVQPGSQSAAAGLVIGDVLTHYDGEALETTFQLTQLARKAAREKHRKIPVLARRGAKEIDGEFDPAPLGVHLVGVKQGDGRTLWRPDTPYQPDLSGLQTQLNGGTAWQILKNGDKTVGWMRSRLVKYNDVLVLRTQSRVLDANLDEKRDVVVSFVPNRYLSLRTIQLKSRDKTILDLRTNSGKLEGERVGVPVSAPFPQDVISAYLASETASTMPRKAGACTRCSYLDAASLASAPFADICCLGGESVVEKGNEIPTFRYEQTVFGETTAEFWIDDRRQLVKAVYGKGIMALRSSAEEIAAQFPDSAKEFENLEPIPGFPPASTQSAN